MKRIELWQQYNFCGVIIPFASGIEWTNQVGGTACMHPVVEGIYLPLSLEWTCGKCHMPRPFFKCKEDDPMYNVSEFASGYSEKLNEQIRLIKKWLHANNLRATFQPPSVSFLDKHGLHEAWIPLRIKSTDDSPVVLDPFDTMECIFTYQNSD